MSSITATRTPRLDSAGRADSQGDAPATHAGSGCVRGRPRRPADAAHRGRRASGAGRHPRAAPSVDACRDRRLARIDLDDFFAAEYDGDDVSRRGRAAAAQLAPADPPRTPGRASAPAWPSTLGLGFVAATGSLANDQPEPTRVVTVQPGQTLWDIAAGVSDGGRRALDDGPPRGDQPPRLRQPPGRPAPPRAE